MSNETKRRKEIETDWLWERETRRIKVSLLCRDECASFVREPEDKSTRRYFLHRLVFRKEKKKIRRCLSRNRDTKSRCFAIDDVITGSDDGVLTFPFRSISDCWRRPIWSPESAFRKSRDISVYLIFNYHFDSISLSNQTGICQSLEFPHYGRLIFNFSWTCEIFFFIQLNACDTFIFFPFLLRDWYYRDN